jgi:DNA-binding MarR family transcriptional regulator
MVIDAGEAELLRTVTRAYSRAQRFEAGCCGLSSSGCQIVCALGPRGSLPQGELGAALGLEKSWVSRAVDALEKEGLAERRKCCEDARMYDVALTKAGRKRYESLNASLDAQAEAVMARIPRAERPMVVKALRLLAAALEAEQSPGPGCPGKEACDHE